MSNVMSISEVRSNLPDLVSTIHDTLGRVTITVNGKPRAVIMSAEEVESLEETSELLAIPGVKKSIKAGLREAKRGQGISLSALNK